MWPTAKNDIGEFQFKYDTMAKKTEEKKKVNFNF